MTPEEKEARKLERQALKEQAKKEEKEKIDDLKISYISYLEHLSDETYLKIMTRTSQNYDGMDVEDVLPLLVHKFLKGEIKFVKSWS